jgi:hypothetical protein
MMREGWGLWFVVYYAVGTLLVSWLFGSPPLAAALAIAAISALVNLVLLGLLRRRPDGDEPLWARAIYVGIPTLVGFLCVYFAKEHFEGFTSGRLNFVFNLLYGQAMIGFWLPVDRAQTKEDARPLYEELRAYLAPAILLFVVSFISGVWQITAGKQSDAEVSGTVVEEFLILSYIGLGFASAVVLLYYHIDVARRLCRSRTEGGCP